MKTQSFEVEVTRTAHSTLTIPVTANNLEEAEQKALQMAGDFDFGPGDNADYEVTGSQLACTEHAVTPI